MVSRKTHSRCTPIFRADSFAGGNRVAALSVDRVRVLLDGTNGFANLETGKGPVKAVAPPISIEHTTADFMLSATRRVLHVVVRVLASLKM